MCVCVCACCACGCAVAERVLKRSADSRIRVMGSPVTLERPSSQGAARQTCSTPGRHVVVSGITADVDVDEDLVLQLENKRRGGGKVDKAEKLTADSVLVTFVDQSSTISNQIKSNQIYFAINSVHNITMSLHCIWLDRQAITSRLCLPMTTKP